MSDNQACENTDREIWREREGDFYADSIHVTKNGGIGINCGGHVIVMTPRNWHRIAQAHLKTLESPITPIDSKTKSPSYQAGSQIAPASFD